MQKRRFDLRQLRDGPMQDLRDRAGRLRAIRSLGTQVFRVRQVRPRAEYIVPAICLLVLALALAWNALSTSQGPSLGDVDGTAVSGTEVAEVGTMDPLATANVEGTAAAPTPVFTDGSGYPFPDGGDVSTPEGIGTVVAGGGDEVIATFEPEIPVITDTAIIDEGFATPTMPNFDEPPLDPGTTAYPGPDQEPQPGQDPAIPEFPTTDPNSDGFDFPTDSPDSGSFDQPTPDFSQQPVFPTDEPFPTDIPFPTDAPFPTDEPFPTAEPLPGDTDNQQDDEQPYPPPGNQSPTENPFPDDGFPTEAPLPDDGFPTEGPLPDDGFPTEEPLPDDGFPTEETPVTDPNEPFPTDGTPDPRATDVTDEPTSAIPPTATATSTPTSPPTPTATPAPTVTPTPDPAVLIQGNVRWPAQGPITLSQNHIVTTGSSLTIDPGVEVRMKPGVKLFVEGALHSAGVAGNPVRFGGPEGRWSTIIGQPGSRIVLEHTELRQGGRTGVALSSTGGSLTLKSVTLTESGGGIVADGSAVDIRSSQITGNDLPTGQPLFVRGAAGAPVTLQGNIFGGNQLPNGTSNVRISVGQGGVGPLDIQGNTFTGGSGPLLDLQTQAATGGTIRCNAFRGASVGLQLSSSTPSAEGFNLVVDSNAFENQAVYGVASTIALAAGSNWWGDPSGPGDAQRNPQGKGVRVGVNVGFDPQLPARPPCAPSP